MPSIVTTIRFSAPPVSNTKCGAITTSLHAYRQAGGRAGGRVGQTGRRAGRSMCGAAMHDTAVKPSTSIVSDGRTAVGKSLAK